MWKYRNIEIYLTILEIWEIWEIMKNEDTINGNMKTTVEKREIQEYRNIENIQKT